MNVREFNSKAWDENVRKHENFTFPSSLVDIMSAKQGKWRLSITGNRFIPQYWLPEVNGKRILCLAGGGGAQGPVLAAAGASVVVFDNSPMQLKIDQDLQVEHNLDLTTVEGDMCDLSCFNDKTFDYIIHPVANVFVENVQPVWAEAYRVLKKGGIMVAGIANPAIYIFDQELLDKDKLIVRNKLPYSDVQHLPPKKLKEHIENKIPLEFGHTLEQQLGGLCRAGFLIADFFEDDYNGEDILDDYLKSLIALKAVKY